jgi:cellulose biosynthesis protein BcsQ
MKTYTFHSYKGGAGRTLAIANFAWALKNKGAKVLLIDCDFDAPGIPYKFNMHTKLKGGYVHYLMSTSVSDRARGTNRGNRIELLKDFLVSVDDGIKILPAGDPERVVYWKHLASTEFHRLFSFAENPKSNARRSLAQHENWIAFKADLHDIKEAAGNPDYCLVDCRAAQETVSVPLLAWADHVVEFFHCNREGVFGVQLVLNALDTNELRPKGFEFTPVVTRVPFGTTLDQIRKEIRAISAEFGNSFLATVNLPTDRLQMLVEQRDIEIGDIIVLNQRRKSEYSLSYAYLELFDSLEHLVSPEEKRSWRIALKLNQEDEVLERYFRLSLRLGELLNKDSERNVALRMKTVVLLMNSLADDQLLTLEKQDVSTYDRKGYISAAFENAGLRAGQNFGQEAMTVKDVWEDGRIPEKTSERLRQWCRFDREVGFGDWTVSYDAEARKGVVRIENHFLKDTNHGVGWSFLKGYVLGVLGYLVGDKSRVEDVQLTEVSPTDLEFTYGDQ